MTKFLLLLPALFLLSRTPSLQSQELPQQFRKLSLDQKLTLLGYMREQGGDIDLEIQRMFEDLAPESRAKTRQMIDLLSSDEKKPQRTSITWDRDTIYYGKIAEGTIVIDSFRVTNTGQSPYLIRDVRSSCDCTVLSYPRFPLMPGENAYIRVEFNSANKIGKARAGIVLYDNSAPNYRSIKFVDGEITPKRALSRKPWE